MHPRRQGSACTRAGVVTAGPPLCVRARGACTADQRFAAACAALTEALIVGKRLNVETMLNAGARKAQQIWVVCPSEQALAVAQDGRYELGRLHKIATSRNYQNSLQSSSRLKFSCSGHMLLPVSDGHVRPAGSPAMPDSGGEERSLDVHDWRTLARFVSLVCHISGTVDCAATLRPSRKSACAGAPVGDRC